MRAHTHTHKSFWDFWPFSWYCLILDLQQARQRLCSVKCILFVCLCVYLCHNHISIHLQSQMRPCGCQSKVNQGEMHKSTHLYVVSPRPSVFLFNLGTAKLDHKAQILYPLFGIQKEVVSGPLITQVSEWS